MEFWTPPLSIKVGDTNGDFNPPLSMKVSSIDGILGTSIKYKS
jgi:hypothetical protein